MKKKNSNDFHTSKYTKEMVSLRCTHHQREGRARGTGPVILSDPPSSRGTRGMRECRTSVINGL